MSVVSRQSAFWAVMALGLNTFVQSPGSGFVRDERLARTARLSPIYCFLDTFCIIVSIVFFYTKTSSIKKSIGLAARFRGMIDEPGLAGHVDPPKLERTWWFRLSIFVFGALPQAVKLLGMRRIPLTQFWGLAYFISFLILEGLQFLGQRVYEEDSDSNLHCESLRNSWVGNMLARFAVDTYICSLGVIMLWATVRNFFKIFRLFELFRIENEITTFAQERCKADMFTATASLFIASGIGSSVCSIVGRGTTGISHRSLDPYQSARVSSPIYHIASSMLGSIAYISTGTSLMLYVATLVMQLFLIPLCFNPQHHASRWMILAWVMSFSGLLLTCIILAMRNTLYFTYLAKKGQPDMIYLVITAAIIAAMLIYYTSIYDPVHTYKPSWTELIG